MIRFATPADAGVIADIHVDTWRVAYDGIVPAAYLASLSKSKRAEDWRRGIAADPRSVLLAEEGPRVAGWVAVGKARESAEPEEGEIYALYVRPDRWRSGIGRSLMEIAEKELWLRGFTRAVLWVLERNLPACAFYERVGYGLDGLKKDISFGDISLVELRYLKKKPNQPTDPA